jgi:hypothetical protein
MVGGGGCRWERLGHGDGSPEAIECVMAAIVPIATHIGNGAGCNPVRLC